MNGRENVTGFLSFRIQHVRGQVVLAGIHISEQATQQVSSSNLEGQYLPEDVLVVKSGNEMPPSNWEYYVHVVGWALLFLLAYQIMDILVGFVTFGVDIYSLTSPLGIFHSMIVSWELFALLFASYECIRAKSK